MQIDTSFDFRTDAAGKDPDTHSPTLRRYHLALWSKPLPSGRHFTLDETTPGAYLHHRSEVGEFFLSSDSVIPTFTRWKALKHIVALFPEEENEAFRRIAYTIGGMMIFPRNRVAGLPTINQVRGFDRRVADRLDLTLECIRRHYLHQSSPLDNTLIRYKEFFALFVDFAGYVDFFLLHDLVSFDCSRVNFFMPFDDFGSAPTPINCEAYREYRQRSIDFVEARNRRINLQCAERLSSAGPLQLSIQDADVGGSSVVTSRTA